MRPGQEARPFTELVAKALARSYEDGARKRPSASDKTTDAMQRVVDRYERTLGTLVRLVTVLEERRLRVEINGEAALCCAVCRRPGPGLHARGCPVHPAQMIAQHHPVRSAEEEDVRRAAIEELLASCMERYLHLHRQWDLDNISDEEFEAGHAQIFDEIMRAGWPANGQTTGAA